MKFTRRDAAKLLALPVLFHASKQAFPEAAAATRKDPAFREAVQAAMLEYIDAAKIKIAPKFRISWNQTDRNSVC